ncbi:DUF6879 family protein [Nocardia transvalensis]|uniref:DUF6879 family protein n=1 Tax=Nocardia transvalensis TaxID=37333 RepID=UPI001893E413|nr:DUF6879 family protein [Nocardia transvalensis]MBF6332524.1 hypothetical protein [Nocardia transvalensis]
MQLLRSDALDKVIHDCRREAFHLELQDEYGTSEGIEPFRNWLEGGRDEDYGWLRSWLDLVSDMTMHGATMRRARVVTVPHTDYTQWLLEVSRQNIAAGEEIRYIPRDRVDPNRLTTDDWWLLDDRTVAFTAFEPDGRLGGGAVTNDPRIVAYCREVRDYVWKAAIPYAEYTAHRTQ